MQKQVITFSLDTSIVDAMDELAHALNQSRTEWLRGVVREKPNPPCHCNSIIAPPEWYGTVEELLQLVKEGVVYKAEARKLLRFPVEP